MFPVILHAQYRIFFFLGHLLNDTLHHQFFLELSFLPSLPERAGFTNLLQCLNTEEPLKKIPFIYLEECCYDFKSAGLYLYFSWEIMQVEYYIVSYFELPSFNTACAFSDISNQSCIESHWKHVEGQRDETETLFSLSFKL